jgi:hypothetical protein
MTLGDELGVFRAMELLVTKHLNGGSVDVRSPELLEDLRSWALNDQFPDPKTGRMLQRTTEEERRMIYRQVFNYGDAEVMEGMATNPDFESLWNSLMVEDVKFIEKAEHSENPESFVSRQNVQQAIEDLQYNLSTHCSGMAKVMTPVMYKELDFIIQRVFTNDEIVAQLALHNSKSYWKVIERILRENDPEGGNVSALQNKAQFGHQILESIAKYTPALMGNNKDFSAFIALVEAFIIVGEQLEHRREGLFQEEAKERAPLAAVGSNGNGSPSDGWNF